MDQTNNTSCIIRMPKVDFDMPITDLIMELEKLRYKILKGTTPPYIFYQIRAVFQMIESIGSSRIEGNNTTIADYIESTKISKETISAQEQIEEIQNIERAMQYIEQNIDDTPINLQLIRELHILAVQGLSPKKEGAAHPGQFRESNVKIGGAKHVPVDYLQVVPLMQELIDFANTEHSPKYDLLKIAIIHHRFVWIHPFENGNGRVVRLFTYALLLKFVFKSKDRIINPTAVFCSDRDAYYHYLALADQGTDEGLISWAEYMLRGLKGEIEKIDNLLDNTYLKSHILIPTLKHALDNKYITETDFKVLTLAINGLIQSSDLLKVLPGTSSSERSRIIRSLIEKKMLLPIKENARKYFIQFNYNYLLRSLMIQLDNNGFLPEKRQS